MSSLQGVSLERTGDRQIPIECGRAYIWQKACGVPYCIIQGGLKTCDVAYLKRIVHNGRLL